MKKKYLLFILCLLMFFCVNIDGAFARPVEGATGKESSNSSNTQTSSKRCIYQDDNFPIAATGAGGTSRGQRSVVLGIDYVCGNGKCDSSYALKAASSGNSYDKYIFNNEADYFGLNVDSSSFYRNGQIECPDSVYIYFNAANGADWAFKYDPGQNVTYRNVSLAYDAEIDEDLDAAVANIIRNGRYSDISVTGEDVNSEKQAGRSESQRIVNSILSWATSHISPTFDVSDLPDCSALLGTGEGSLGQMLKNIFFGISIVGILLLIILTAIDFIKAIASSDEEDTLIKAFKRSKNRIIAIIILLLLPVLVSVIINLINNNVYVADGEIKVGDIKECNITN